MHYAAHNTAKDVTREAGEARRCNWKLYYRQICPFWRCGQILDYFGQCTSSTADGGKWQLGVSSTNCWTVPRYRESKNFLSANCNDPTTDDYALSTQLLSDFRWGASSMRHNPQRWQEQLLMELLSDLRSQGGIISAFILPIPIVITLKNRVLMECMTQQRRRGAGDSTRRAAGGAKSTHEHYVRHPHQITTILSSSCLKIFFLPQKNQKKVPWLVV